NLSFDDAFNIILLSQDLAADRRGDIINVMTSLEYEKLYGKKYTDKRRIKRLKLNYAKPSVVFNALGQLKSDVGKIIVDESSGTVILIDIPERLKVLEEAFNRLDQPLDTAVFDLKYAKPADIKAHLSSAITPGLGEVFVDEKSGKIVVSDMPDKIAKIRNVIRAFDAAPLQVFIEAEIVQLVLNDQFQRGVDWKKIFGDEEWIKWAKLTGLTLVGLFPATGTFIDGAFQKVTVGTLDANKYTGVLKFLQTYGNTKTLSRPRLAVVDNQEAKIMVGKRDAYVSQTLSQAQTTTVTSESVQFVDVGVKLNVVPSISSDGFIVMKIKPEVSTVESILTTYLKSQIPIIATSEAETVVKVKDGTMIMIAGLMKEENVDDIQGWPYLSKVKVLDAAFGNRSTQRKNTELIIFITPHIITGEAPVDDHTMEDLYPADVLPRPLKEDLIDKKVGEIGAKKDRQNANSKKEDIASKMKGIKK
ncbi:MAG: secretin N-terminal domain-containing protein, partial [Candidatus Omnitrophota bacterium]|nr:secretin N-terminal domain-containing protein [Candidatus Omnitrophota bacterium]